jgi:hypothetical protein
VIRTTLLRAEDGLKSLRVKIAVIDLVASAGQSVDDAAMKRGLKAAVERMCIYDEKPHGLCLSKALACGGSCRPAILRREVALSLSGVRLS